jgi:hypothetical protein
MTGGRFIPLVEMTGGRFIPLVEMTGGIVKTKWLKFQSKPKT